MTHTVDRWSRRAVAQARRDKHAQRTPLPPKGSMGVGNPTAEILKQMLEEEKAKK